MQDPIGSFERIRELYISYLDTAFRIEDGDVAEERRALLRSPGTLTTEPLVEPIPRYVAMACRKGKEVTFDDLYRLDDPERALDGLSEPARRAFVELVLAGLFPSKPRAEGDPLPLPRVGAFPPYEHQVRMLQRGLRRGRPGVVTSGTGSGKTEAFLLPVLARIAQEAVGWRAPGEGYLSRRWWHDQDGKPLRRKRKDGTEVPGLPRDRRPSTRDPLAGAFEAHRRAETRPAAVRAILLYPMNALVEDQLVRLRKALDSKEAREAEAKHFHGNRVYFGRYIGATPIPGHAGALDESIGLDAFLAAGKKEASKGPAIWCPDHKAADPATGEVSRSKLWADELQRRQRRYDDLFAQMMEMEIAARDARLHALDVEARPRLERRLDAWKKENAGKRIDRATFVELARSCGRRLLESLDRQLADLVGESGTLSEESALAQTLLGPEDAISAPTALSDDSAAFTFSAVDGGEQVSRWDMQSHPPDILITNVSMVSAMLGREVDDPILRKTREWLESSDDSYFYLVLDELHLQRGAAGTEVSYLLRLLLDRLGLTRPEHRHKLRVLASSASLPTFPESAARESREFLWQMFGPYGLDPAEVERCEEAERPSLWQEAIVAGRERSGRYRGGVDEPAKLAVAPFSDLLDLHRPAKVLDEQMPLATPLTAQMPVAGTEGEARWRAACAALGATDSDLGKAISQAIEEATERLIHACWEEPQAGDEPGSGRTRAQPLSFLAQRLLAAAPATVEDRERLAKALRGLLFLRGAEDTFRESLPRRDQPLPSFRVHTFFRSIEGLFAPAVRIRADRKAPVGPLAIEQRPKIVIDGRELRVFELLYCECCGGVFFGGIRAQTGEREASLFTELLPQEENLAALPDEAVTQRFEQMSWETYAVFWPGNSSLDQAELLDADQSNGAWLKAALDPDTGAVYKGMVSTTVQADGLPPGSEHAC